MLKTNFIINICVWKIHTKNNNIILKDKIWLLKEKKHKRPKEKKRKKTSFIRWDWIGYFARYSTHVTSASITKAVRENYHDILFSTIILCHCAHWNSQSHTVGISIKSITDTIASNDCSNPWPHLLPNAHTIFLHPNPERDIVKYIFYCKKKLN